MKKQLLILMVLVMVILPLAGCGGLFDKALKEVPLAEFEEFILDGIIFDIDVYNAKLIEGKIEIEDLKITGSYPSGHSQSLTIKGWKRIIK